MTTAKNRQKNYLNKKAIKMTTKKQIHANQNNALLSTGAVTEEGKTIVSKNAVKHGIFTQDLIISNGKGKESEEEYIELLNNLYASLNPSGQVEHLLVEKIAVDFWRLRRVLRFETGSIREYLDMAICDSHSGENKKNIKNDELDAEIEEEQRYVNHYDAYIKALKKSVVNFDKSTWESDGLKIHMYNELCDVVETNKNRILKGEELLQFEEGELEYPQLRSTLERAEYTDKDIAAALIAKYEKKKEGYKEYIYELEKTKNRNENDEEINIKACSLPDIDSAEKVMKYEKSIQKSIFQNLSVLKKLQSLS
jgi:hypothetical protein